ncbi:chaperonin 10-like protein [Lipomyces tetrasporus]|uniref:Chaperonin 10-like protein n=1 Tax=Lipomyces tetrasporus TaxID=54092 RepID=A0AAD7QRS8_9ASCO|nr:chaperonin 10-like protein [Lipomyces tetrasporus]KAJ8100140.1 chaperonin 10-like protein [Lipomyces tetrasporus]
MGFDFTVYKGSHDGKVLKSTTHKDDLKGDQVLVKVTHSGVCFTDVHYRQADMVLGHEGAGIVAKIGPDVKDLKVGDAVGWGYEHDCCGRCNNCLSGMETMCPDRKLYGLADLDQGSFASHAVWREAFLFKIPANLSNEDAAPLMCAGSTIFNALHLTNVKPTSRVGIVGVGGLGHLAIQFVSKMGCETVVFSSTESKKNEAIRLGAKEFYATKGVTSLNIGKPLDHLIVTTSSQPDWNLYIGLMAPGGTISPISVDNKDLTMPYMPLLMNTLRIQGGIISPRKVHRDMLDFAAFHGIKPINMLFPFNVDGIERCLKTLTEGKMRYRGVLVAED